MTQRWILFLDDEREPSFGLKVSGNVVVARTSAHALHLVRMNGMPYVMQLDHDLGMTGGGMTRSDVPDTTMTFLRGLAEMFMFGEISFPDDFSYDVHSQNPIGVENIRSYIDNLIRVFKVK